MAFRISNIKIIFHIDAPWSHNSALKMAPNPLLHVAFRIRRKTWRFIQRCEHFRAYFKPYPSSQKRRTLSLASGTRKAAETSRCDVTSNSWVFVLLASIVTFGSDSCDIQIQTQKKRHSTNNFSLVLFYFFQGIFTFFFFHCELSTFLLCFAHETQRRPRS